MLSSKLLIVEPEIERRLKKAHYGIYKHGAVEICKWTKTSIKNKGDCYKSKFYGIDTHRCMQFTPMAIWCQHNCIFCWRPIDLFKMLKIDESMVTEPKELIDGLIKERLRLLSGFGGNKNVDKVRLKEALIPTHYAISLSGEPTLYPKLSELIQYLHQLKYTKSIFLVTNGQEPTMLQRLQKERSLPTQLYLSMNASNKAQFLKIHLPEYKDCWERFIESLNLIQKINTRSVIRLTMIKGINTNEENILEFSKFIEMSKPHFLEIKSYMHIGSSIQRLNYSHMLSFYEIYEYGKKFNTLLPKFKIINYDESSRIVLLQNMERYINVKI